MSHGVKAQMATGEPPGRLHISGTCAGLSLPNLWNFGHRAFPFFNVAVSTLPPSWSGISGDAAASASCGAFSAASMNCCDSFKRFRTSSNFCDEAHMGWRSWRRSRSVSASPWLRASSSSSFGIASQESWFVNLDAAPHTKDLILMEAAYLADE